jgi:peptide/nickel transport system substrate-binding protein
MNVHKLLFSVLVAASFFSCGNEALQDSSTIHVRLKKDPERINPLLFPNPTAREVYQYLHLPLADFDPNTLELEPLLIKEIPKPIQIDTGKYSGGIAFDIEMHEKATWDNGSPITAADYSFTLKSIMHPLTGAGKYREIASQIADVIPDPKNERKFRVIFDQPYILALEAAINIEIYPSYFYDSLQLLKPYSLSGLLSLTEEQFLADSNLVIFARNFNANDFSRTRFSGAGPYSLVSWNADQEIILEKKQDYWADDFSQAALQQGPDRMIFHIIPDELTAVTQLKAGGIDIINEISAENYRSLQADSGNQEKFSFFHPSLTKHYMITLNNRDVRLNDARVRRALAHLVDVQNMITYIENGMGTPSVGPVHPMKKAFNGGLKPIAFDVSKAKILLAEADWKDSDQDGILDKVIAGKKTDLSLEILISGQELGKRLSVMLQENAAKAGVGITITEKDFKQIRAEHLKTRNYQLVPSVLSQDIVKWDDLSKWHSKNDTPDGSNEMSYMNPKTDALIDQIEATSKEDDRIRLYREIQSLIYEDQPAIFLYAPEEKIVVSNKWKASATSKRPGYLANTFTLR